MTYDYVFCIIGSNQYIGILLCCTLVWLWVPINIWTFLNFAAKVQRAYADESMYTYAYFILPCLLKIGMNPKICIECVTSLALFENWVKAFEVHHTSYRRHNYVRKKWVNGDQRCGNWKEFGSDWLCSLAG